MAYGTPTSSPGSSVWYLTVSDSTVVSEELVAIQFTSDRYIGPGEHLADAEGIFQKIITALASDSDLVVHGMRTHPTSQVVTP